MAATRNGLICLKSLGILCLLRDAAGQGLTIADLVECSTNGRDSVTGGINELVARGYVTRRMATVSGPGRTPAIYSLSSTGRTA